MITDYAASVDQWEPWQREYRFGVILILPPEPLLSQVNALRTAYDSRSQSYCDAHISLSIPLPRPVTAEHWRELEAAVEGIQPFRIEYGPLRHYLPHPGVCLAIEPHHVLEQLVGLVEGTSVFAGASGRRYPFSPHMTIAEFISPEQTETLMTHLADSVSSGSFRCAGLSYAVPDERLHFTERRSLAFRGGPEPCRTPSRSRLPA